MSSSYEVRVPFAGVLVVVVDGCETPEDAASLALDAPVNIEFSLPDDSPDEFVELEIEPDEDGNPIELLSALCDKGRCRARLNKMEVEEIELEDE